MKFRDIIRLIGHEYRYGKTEWMISVILQILIFTCVLFLFTVALDIDNVGNDYIKPLYPKGYGFYLKAFDEQDIPELEKMGFYDIVISNVGSGGYAVTDNLDNIWMYKWKAVCQGKDIWNGELEEILSVLFFFQLTFGATGIIMMIILLNNLSNSFAMKLTQRKQYIRMLYQLGCSRHNCEGIFYGFFSIRNMMSLLIAAFLNGYLIHILNQHISALMHIRSGFAVFRIFIVLGVGLLHHCLMRISFHKQWSVTDEI